MKFHEQLTSKLRAITELQQVNRHREAAFVKRFSPIEYLREKAHKLIDAYKDAVHTVYSVFDPETGQAWSGQINSEAFLAANAGIRNAIQTIVELEWFEIERPFYNVYPIVEKLVRNTKLNVPIAQLNFSPSTICFRFPKGHEPFGIKTALIKVGSFDTPAAKRLSPLFTGPNNPDGDARLFVAGSFEVVDDEDRFMIQIPESLLADIGGKTATVEEMLNASTKKWERQDEITCAIAGTRYVDIVAEDLPMYTQRLYFLFRLSVLASLLAGGNDLITPAILASEQEKYDLEIDEAAKRWMEERAARIQGRGFDFGKKLQLQSEMSPHWRNPHMALYWTGEGRTKPVLKLRAGSVVIPKHLSSVPTGYDCPLQDDAAAVAEHVYFLRDPSQGFVKIGRTRRDISARLRESSTFVPGGLTLLGYIKTADCVALETRLHREYAHLRRDNEFFALSVEEAQAVVESFGGVFCANDN